MLSEGPATNVLYGNYDILIYFDILIISFQHKSLAEDWEASIIASSWIGIRIKIKLTLK